MIKSIIIALILVCIIIIGNATDQKIISKYKFLLLAPFPLIILILFSFYTEVSHSVPLSNNLTKLVVVDDNNGEEYLWNLAIDVHKESLYDDGTKYTLYQVLGYKQPSDGKLISCDTDSFQCFGEETSFHPAGNYDITYTTTINESDVSASLVQRFRYLDLLTIFIYLVALVISITAMIISIRYLKNPPKTLQDC